MNICDGSFCECSCHTDRDIDSIRIERDEALKRLAVVEAALKTVRVCDKDCHYESTCDLPIGHEEVGHMSWARFENFLEKKS